MLPIKDINTNQETSEPGASGPPRHTLKVGRAFVWTVLAALAITALGFSFYLRHTEQERLASLEQEAREWARSLSEVRGRQVLTPLMVERGSSLGSLLQRANVDGITTHQIIMAARPVVDFRRLRQGQQLLLARS